MRCVILDDYQQVALGYADWSRLADVETTTVDRHLADEDTLVAALIDAEIVVVIRERTPLTPRLLSRLSRLRLVVTSGMRNASLDLAACAERGVTVCGTASSSTPPTELTWALVLGLARQVVPEALALRAGERQTTIGTDLAGAKLGLVGLVGLGKIGTQIAAVGRAFGMEVVAWSPHLTDDRAEAAGARRVDKRALFGGSDVVSVHLVLAEATRGSWTRPRSARCASRRTSSTPPGQGWWTTMPGWRRSTPGGCEAPSWTSSTTSRCRPIIRCAAIRGCPDAAPRLRHGRQLPPLLREAVEDVEAWLSGSPVRVL